MHILQQQKKMHNGPPKMGQMKTMKSNVAKVASVARTGDAISDESDNGEAEADCTAIEDDSDSDEADAFALSGVRRPGKHGVSRLAGLTPPADFDMDGQQASAGAERESDDEDYDAVGELSESEDDEVEDEKKVLRSAEQDLIAEFERTEKPRTDNAFTTVMNEMSLKEDAALARRLSQQSQTSQPADDLDLDLDMNQDPFNGASFMAESQLEMWDEAEGLFDGDLAQWRNPDSATNTLGLMDILSREESTPSNTNQKKVRFEETASSRSSSMSSEDDPRDAYPDLFDSQDDLAARQRAMLAGVDIDAIQDGESVYDFDFEDEYEKQAFEIDGQSDSDEESSDSDSDGGDTTDEEDPEEQLARVLAIKAACEARNGKVAPANTPASEPSTPVPSKRSPPVMARGNSGKASATTPKSNGRPKMGTFARDPTRATVTADIKGSGVKLVCPTKPPAEERAYWERARQAVGSRDGSPGGSVSWTCATPRPAKAPFRPLTARSTLGTMFDGNLDFLRNNDENGIADELLVPSRSDSMQSSMVSAAMTNDEESEYESDVQMEDFLQIRDDDSDDEEEPQSASDVFSPTQSTFSDAVFDSPVYSRPGTSNGLLGHLEQQRGLVSSFRNNQHHVRQVTSLPVNPSQRAQRHEANALQKGRRAAANTPMTPARKQRQSQNLDMTNAGISKTASPVFSKRRRSRGISITGMDQTLTRDRFAGNRQ